MCLTSISYTGKRYPNLGSGQSYLLGFWLSAKFKGPPPDTDLPPGLNFCHGIMSCHKFTTATYDNFICCREFWPWQHLARNLSQDFWHLPCDIFSARDSIILKKNFKSKNCLNPKNYNFTINCINDSITINLEIDSPSPAIKVIILYYFF